MESKSYTIYIKKSDFTFLNEVLYLDGIVDFEEVKDFNKNEYEILITQYDLESLLGFISCEANHTNSRRNALRLDKIATRLEAHLYPGTYIFY